MSVVVRTHTGKVRENNEDSLLLLHPKLFAIADGMGGYNAGEVASEMALYGLRDASPGLEGLDGTLLVAALHRIVRQINRTVYEKAREIPEYNGMGTTLTGVYLDGAGKAYIFHVGDSRVYLMRDGRLKQITTDHSLVGELLERGEITPEEACDRGKQNSLTRGIGVTEDVTGDGVVSDVYRDDMILLCSDGLTDMVRDRRIETVLQQRNLQIAADDLLRDALDAGGKDNISFIIIRMDGKKEPMKDTAEIKTTGAWADPDTKTPADDRDLFPLRVRDKKGNRNGKEAR